MDWSQWLYLAELAVASAIGFRRPDLIAIMAANMGFTLVWSGLPFAVGMFDLACAWTLWAHGPRGKVIGGLFVAMQPVYVLAWATGLPDGTTYAIIDAIAAIQLVVLSNADRFIGKRNSRKPARNISVRPVASLAIRSTRGTLGVSEKDMRR